MSAAVFAVGVLLRFSRRLVLLAAAGVLIRSMVDRHVTMLRMIWTVLALPWYLIGDRLDMGMSRAIAGFVAAHMRATFIVLLFLFFILCGIGFILLSLEHDREQKERIRQTIRQMGRENGS